MLLINLIFEFCVVIVQAGCTPRAWLPSDLATCPWCVTYTYRLHSEFSIIAPLGGRGKLASTPGPTEFVGPGSRCLILHGWSLGNAIAQKHHYDNAHKQLTVCCRSQELLLSTTSSCQHLFQMLGSLHGDGTDSAR